MPQRLKIALCILSIAPFFFSAARAQTLSISPVKVYFSESSITAGYTLKTEGDECWLGVPNNSFAEGTTHAIVSLRLIKKKTVKNTFGDAVSLSPIFKFNIRKTAALDQSLWISIAWRKTTEQTYVLKQWNADTSTWDDLNSTITADGLRVQGEVIGQSGMVGVFEAPKPEEATTHSGKASWFSGNSINGYGSAMNIFPIGTKVRVTNTANNKTVETTIVSTGPFVPGRIIDLSKDAFNAISNTSVGVIDVVVEEVK
ncbi:MAG: septal ring lytic transglycosylase RlpA family protein [Candidatus Kerfeldbacteria bacterium]|nr:septal ring lytic transglycosylase RlpA family protein [Candidatus Kerfeldbacteria bacterium]